MSIPDRREAVAGLTADGTSTPEVAVDEGALCGAVLEALLPNSDREHRAGALPGPSRSPTCGG